MNRRTLTKKKIKREKIQYLRLEMCCYNDTKKAIESNILTSQQIIIMQNIINKIDMSLAALEKTTNGKLKRIVIEDMYWKSTNLDYYGLAFKYNLHFNTISHWDKEFFNIFSHFFGIYLPS